MIFPYIEDYIEYLAGYRDTGSKIINYYPSTQPVRLASRDCAFISSVAEQTIVQSKPMSTGQARLALQLISTYARQLTTKGIDQPNHTNYRKPLKTSVYVNSVTIEDDVLRLRFKYNIDTIQLIKDFSRTSCGRVYWKPEKRSWDFAITDSNISWLVTLATSHDIPVDEDIQWMFDQILEVEKTPYAIELCINDNQELYISNAPTSMLDYLGNALTDNDIYKLVDYSGLLGYTISDDISKIISDMHSPGFMKLCSLQAVDFPNASGDEVLDLLVNWAITVGRLPIYVYNPNVATPKVDLFKKYFADDEIQSITMNTVISPDFEIDKNIKVVYTTRVLSIADLSMPVLVSYANLMYGSNKREFLAKAEKVVYNCITLPRF